MTIKKGKQSERNLIDVLSHDIDLALEIWTDDFLTKTSNRGLDRKLRNDDQYRGYLLGLKWVKKRVEELRNDQ